jgi:hypothetical protein
MLGTAESHVLMGVSLPVLFLADNLCGSKHSMSDVEPFGSPPD